MCVIWRALTPPTRCGCHISVLEVLSPLLHSRERVLRRDKVWAAERCRCTHWTCCEMQGSVKREPATRNKGARASRAETSLATETEEGTTKGDDIIGWAP